MASSRHTVRKRFGQHWLKDFKILNKIIDAAEIESSDCILEIGPGRGALTQRLLSSGPSSLHSIEIDRDLIIGLKKRFGDDPRFSLLESDILSVPFSNIDGRKYNKVVANIPYNITSPILQKLLGDLSSPVENNYELLVLLIQKEVADRIVAKPKQNSFSALSVRIQLLAECKSVCLVSPNCFIPPPKVQSQVIALRPFDQNRRIDSKLASRVEVLLRTAFLARRKMLRNSFSTFSFFDELDVLAKSIGISLSQRPQELSPDQWVALANDLNQLDDLRKSQ